MPDLNVFVSEFIAIITYCIEEKNGYYIKQNTSFAIDKTNIITLMNRNKYETAFAKLAIWKQLRWIDTDSGHITKSVYIKSKSKQNRMIVVDVGVYEQLKALCAGT